MLLHVHQLEEAELSFFIIEKKIDIGILLRIVARGLPEKVKMRDPELFQFGFVRLELGYGGVALH